jgi:hypothetical protein
MKLRLGIVIALGLSLSAAASSTALAAAFPWGGATIANNSGVSGVAGVHRVPGVGTKIELRLAGLTPGAWYRWQLRINDNLCGPFAGGGSAVAGSAFITPGAYVQANAAGEVSDSLADPAVVPANQSAVTIRVDELGPGGAHACGTVEDLPIGAHTWW